MNRLSEGVSGMSPSLLHAGPQPVRDIAFSQADFDRIRSLIRQKAGIDLHVSKHNMVYSRLSRRLRDQGYANFGSYLDKVQAGGVAEQAFINSLTTNLTAFYREAHHFDLLALHLQQLRGAPPRIWCCAASTGEEPYSIAMTVAETLGMGAACTIDASDVDTDVLATAERGVYAIEGAKGLPEDRLRRYFLRGTGGNAGKIRVKPELGRMVAFRPFNLLSNVWPATPYDIVFCRNVMIYFDRQVQRQVLEGLYRSLKPGGLLVVGHSENFGSHRDLFVLSGKTVYTRTGG